MEIIKCDISDKAECLQAFTGAYGIFSINKHWDATDDDEYKQTVNLVEAAKAANVQHLITSGLPNTGALNKNQFDTPSHSM